MDSLDFRLPWFVVLIGLALVDGSAGQDAEPLRVRAEMRTRGPYFVGQGLELDVGVVARGQRPEVEPPRIDGAVAWKIGTDLKPISVGGIGEMVSQQNIFVTGFRVVPRRPGRLEIPPIRARLKDRAGRSRPLRLSIQPVPVEGRPAEFLGGVGKFTLESEATPKVVRVGQELEFRVKVAGPAAWGMSARPDLARFERLAIGPRIESKPDETSEEPPERTFVYALRPTRSGEVVLPPVAIAAFDESLRRYVTHVTAGVPIRVVAVPILDPTSIEVGSPGRDVGGQTLVIWIACGLSTILLLSATASLVWIRRRRGPLTGPPAARRYAARLARSLGAARTEPDRDDARRVSEELIRYLQIGAGRPPGALTPEEARRGVVHCTGSDELGARASRLAARCDQVLYGEFGNPEPDGRELLGEARGLFRALGRVESSRHRGRSVQSG